MKKWTPLAAEDDGKLESFCGVYRHQSIEEKKEMTPVMCRLHSCLDYVWKWVHEQIEEERDHFLRALGVRTVIMLPAHGIPNLVSGFRDGVDAEKQLPLFASTGVPGLDAYRVELIRQIRVLCEANASGHGFPSDPELWKWMLTQLEQRIELGSWDAYSASRKKH